MLTVDETEAAAARMAFRLFDTTRLTLAEIAEQLNAAGYQTSQEARIGAKQVQRIIQRRKV